MGKHSIDADTRTLILKYISKYDEYHRRYLIERDAVLFSSSSGERVGKSPSVPNPTQSAAEKLLAIERKHYVVIMHAIEEAREKIGADLQDATTRWRLRRAIWLSCVDRYEWPFERFAGFVPYERTAFYEQKNKFLCDIKNILGL